MGRKLTQTQILQHAALASPRPSPLRRRQQIPQRRDGRGVGDAVDLFGAPVALEGGDDRFQLLVIDAVDRDAVAEHREHRLQGLDRLAAITREGNDYRPLSACVDEKAIINAAVGLLAALLSLYLALAMALRRLLGWAGPRFIFGR